MPRVLLSIGSNIEPRRRRLHDAFAIISTSVLENATVSPLYVTAPVGYVDQPDFYNAAIVGTSAASAEDLHHQLKNVESTIGRLHRERWREREIDVDIIIIEGLVVNTDTLTIPHPRMRERRFVLQPSADVAADLVDPVTGRTVAELLDVCPDTSSVLRLD